MKATDITCANEWKAVERCTVSYAFINVFFMTNLTAAAGLLGLR
jgi:hypothetical protein